MDLLRNHTKELEKKKLVHLARCRFFEAVRISSVMTLEGRRFAMESALNYFYDPRFKVSLDDALEVFCRELYKFAMPFYAGDLSDHTLKCYFFLLYMVKNFLELGADCRQGRYCFLEKHHKIYLRIGSFEKARPDLMLLESNPEVFHREYFHGSSRSVIRILDSLQGRNLLKIHASMNLLRKYSQDLKESEELKIVNTIMPKILELIVSGEIETSENRLIDFSQVLISCYPYRSCDRGGSGLEKILSRILFWWSGLEKTLSRILFWWSGEPLDSVDNFFGENFRRRLDDAKANAAETKYRSLIRATQGDITPLGEAGKLSAIVGKFSFS